MLNIKAGSTYQSDSYYLNDDETPIDISGWTARMELWDGVGTGASLVLDCSAYLTIYGTEGRVAIEIPASETAELSGGGVADLEIQSPSGFVFALLDLETWGVTPELISS